MVRYYVCVESKDIPYAFLTDYYIVFIYCTQSRLVSKKYSLLLSHSIVILRLTKIFLFQLNKDFCLISPFTGHPMLTCKKQITLKY